MTRPKYLKRHIDYITGIVLNSTTRSEFIGATLTI